MNTSLVSRKTVLIFAFLLIASIGWTSEAMSQTATLESVTLSKSAVPWWCPMPREIPGTGCTKQDARIEIVSVVKNPGNEPVDLVYIVSDGEIIGRGPRVVWDLHQARPGKHSITVGISRDDKMIVSGQTITRSVVMEDCPVCHLPCECATITVRGPNQAVTVGDAFVVEAELRGGGNDRFPKYVWTASEGTVIEGQGAARALVRTDAKSKSTNLKMQLQVNNNPICDCPDTAALTVTLVLRTPGK